MNILDKTNPLSIDEIGFVFKEKEDGSIFSRVGKSVAENDSDTDLKLDVGVVYKKSALADVASLLLRKSDLNDEKILSRIFKGLGFLLLVAVYPKATQLVFTDENNFEELRKYLRTENGMQYFFVDEVENDNDIKKITTLLLNDGYLVEKDGRYYMKGYHLDKLKLTNV